MMHDVLTRLYERGLGIIQMRCPEQTAWGGVQKRHLWRMLYSKNKLLYLLRPVILPVFIFITKNVYRSLARCVVRDVINYQNAGYEVVGVIGVDGSPSCGVLKRLNVDCSMDILVGLSLDTLNPKDLNRRLYGRCLEHGRGIFIEELKQQIERKNLPMHFYSVDLVKEMRGEKQEISLSIDSASSQRCV